MSNECIWCGKTDKKLFVCRCYEGKRFKTINWKKIIDTFRYWLIPFQTWKIWLWRIRLISLINYNMDYYHKVPTLREKYMKGKK